MYKKNTVNKFFEFKLKIREIIHNVKEKGGLYMTDFKSSNTLVNLMRAFAGESQARNRYTIAAKKAAEQKLTVIEKVFSYTAEQEKIHAQVFYNFMKDKAGEKITITADYPVDVYDDMIRNLRSAQHNEFDEHDPIYKTFAEEAKREGFMQIASVFNMIADIERVHGERFGRFADLLEQNELFSSNESESWICLNCGFIHTGKDAPQICPVCKEERGYFVRWEMSPFSDDKQSKWITNGKEADVFYGK